MSNIETSGAEGRFTGSVEVAPGAIAEGQQPQEQQGQQQEGTADGEQKAPPVDWEKRYKDAQAELTKLQQKAKEPKAGEGEGQEQQGQQQDAEGEEGSDEEGAGEAEGEGQAQDGEGEGDLEAEIAAKVDIPKYEAEFAKDGRLSDESMAELAAKGFGADDVNDFVVFRVERNKRFTEGVSTEVGGEEVWTAIQAWAKDNMSTEDRDAFNKGMADAAGRRDIAAAKLLAAGVVQKYNEANGFGASRSATDGGAAEGDGGDSSGYTTKAEWQAEHRSEAYRNDPTTRAHVDAKLQRSGWYKAQHGIK